MRISNFIRLTQIIKILKNYAKIYTFNLYQHFCIFIKEIKLIKLLAQMSKQYEIP